MIKLIVSDIDGTLVKDGTLDINPEYMDVIKKLTEKGIHFVACSGRQYSSEKQLFAPVKDIRSEERRVGKECRSRWSPYH